MDYQDFWGLVLGTLATAFGFVAVALISAKVEWMQPVLRKLAEALLMRLGSELTREALQLPKSGADDVDPDGMPSYTRTHRKRIKDLHAWIAPAYLELDRAHQGNLKNYVFRIGPFDTGYLPRLQQIRPNGRLYGSMPVYLGGPDCECTNFVELGGTELDGCVLYKPERGNGSKPAEPGWVVHFERNV